MNYETAKSHMDEIQKKGSILGLKPIKLLLERLQNPQNKLAVIHVTGTNGKGSVCAFLEQLYMGEEKKVGRYISPTLNCYLERYQINGKSMSREEFAYYFSKVYPHIEAMRENGEDTPTAFEIETVIAFLFFLEKGVDIVILETGMGGREDATNVVENPLCTVFVSIGMDHMQFLGDTVEKIAYEKAGIMRKDCPVICYPNPLNINHVLMKEYEKINGGLHNVSEFHVINKEDVRILEETLNGSRFMYKGEEYSISLAGRYQIYNAITAIETKYVLDGYMNKDFLSKVSWAGRFEKISDKPLFIRDGAHNMDGVKALKESIEKHFTNREIIFIIGVLKDKEYEKMMALLCPMAKKVYTITAPGERGLPADVLAGCVKPYCNDVSVCNNVEEAILKAGEFAMSHRENEEESVVIAWGSLSYIGQIH
ncbi:MAG: bifunctional folylpolyglutamate synthase/dihydrofolate synthase [Lachnospiraceae bacterium]